MCGATGGGREDDAGKVQPTAGSNRRNQAPARRQVAAAGERETAARKKQRRGEAVISHFFAGECTERGRPVKALRFAPTADAARTKRAALTRLPLRSCLASSYGKNEKKKWEGCIPITTRGCSLRSVERRQWWSARPSACDAASVRSSPCGARVCGWACVQVRQLPA